MISNFLTSSTSGKMYRGHLLGTILEEGTNDALWEETSESKHGKVAVIYCWEKYSADGTEILPALSLNSTQSIRVLACLIGSFLFWYVEWR